MMKRRHASSGRTESWEGDEESNRNGRGVKERERQTDRQTDRQIATERQRDRADRRERRDTEN